MDKNVKLESKALAAAASTRRQTVPTKKPEPSRLTPELKGFIDRVVVPILVKSYVEKLQNEKAVAESGKKPSSCQPMNDALQVMVA